MGPVVGVEAVVGVFILYFCFAVVKETGFVVLAGCCCELVYGDVRVYARGNATKILMTFNS